MAKHKAPTQVTIATIQQQSLFNELVERYWKIAILGAVLASAAILFPHYRKTESRKEFLQRWDELRAQSDFGSGFFVQVRGGSAAALDRFAEEHRGQPMAAWAKAVEIGTLVEEEKMDEAEAAVAELKSGWSDHLLATGAFYPGPDGTRRTLEESIRVGRAELAAWEKEHAFLFENPALPADAPRVRLQTSKGPIVVGLYSDRVPQHVEAFLKLCREGGYNGTRFHEVQRGSYILGGDPNTVSGTPETWGLGGSPDGVEGESDPALRHFKGSLVAWRAPGATRSHATQFFLTTSDQNQRDGQSVVFGKVLEGEATLEAIESSPILDGKPQDPAILESVEML